ncbi:MAG: glycosyltransferase [Clostridia bacterium]|nr:glycosyltransferase [Clostridia bacterium]
MQSEVKALKSEAYSLHLELSSFRFLIGTVCVEAVTSIKGFLRFPLSVYRLLKEGARRKKTEGPAFHSNKARSETTAAAFSQTPSAARSRFNREAVLEMNRSLVRGDYIDPDRPPVSVILLHRTEQKGQAALFASFRSAVFYDNYEIIVLDNVLTDASTAFLEKEKRQTDKPFLIVRGSPSLTFSQAANLAAAHASGSFLVFLCSDTEVTDYWLDELLWAAQEHPCAGIFGAKLVYPGAPDNPIFQDNNYRIARAGIVFQAGLNGEDSVYKPVHRSFGKNAFTDGTDDTRDTAAVSADALMINKALFVTLNGFDAPYEEGYAGADLCLRARQEGHGVRFTPSSLVIWQDGTRPADDGLTAANPGDAASDKAFQDRWQVYLTDAVFRDRLDGGLVFSETPLRIVFIVTQAGAGTQAGDYFTAMELAEALAKRGCEILYRETINHGAYPDGDPETHADVLISMLHTYDVSYAKERNPRLVTIAWMRNWFDGWCDNSSVTQYDILLTTSRPACDYVAGRLGREPLLFPIAANAKRFLDELQKPDIPYEQRRYQSDYVFTGSYWNHPRDIAGLLDPAGMPYRLRLFGANWEMFPHLAGRACGFIPYEDIPKVYKYTQLVLDDANHTTKALGAVNSRVFDALAAGRLVLTNGMTGAAELFGGLLPVFSTKEELRALIDYYMEHPEQREEKAKALQAIVLANHTYDIRAERLLNILREFADGRTNARGTDAPLI